MRRYELGEPDPDGEPLFARAAFKDALPEVSEVRLAQTLYAEHPDLRESVEKLRGAKTLQSVETLTKIWGTRVRATRQIADRSWTWAFLRSAARERSRNIGSPFSTMMH